MDSLQNKLKNLPKSPGVYLLKSKTGEVLYVGKAKNLKNRIKTYFVKSAGDAPRTEMLKGQIADIDYIVVSSEPESLILETNLIKQYQPRFNVLMRDDKNYQFIKIDYSTEIPSIYSVRKVQDRPSRSEHSGEIRKFGSRYFGPYTSGLAVKNTLKLIKRVFRLCRNKKISNRPCFAYHLGRCGGVCIGAISALEYAGTMKQAEDFLKHKQGNLIRELRGEMAAAAKSRRFEKAAVARDKLRALEHLWEKQKIVSAKNEFQDYLGTYKNGKQAIFCMFQVRFGRLIHTEYFELWHKGAPDEEILEKFIQQYYSETSDPPREILVPSYLRSREFLSKAVSRLAEKKIKITAPQKGKKKQLLGLAQKNAQLYFERELASYEKQKAGALKGLQNFLGIKNLPERIEGYDISNIQGVNPVGSMVVFVNGRPGKSEYRKFKINTKETPDDYSMMKEMLNRRFARSHVIARSPRRSNLDGIAVSSRQSGTPRNDDSSWPLPDLIVIDGGKGQLNVALSVQSSANGQLSDVPIIGLAKRLEEIYVPGRKDPLRLSENSPVLHLLQQIRDEAHRFAVTFHRAQRSKRQTISRLDDIAGVGPKTRKKLLQKFGSVSDLRPVSAKELAKVVGAAKAKQIKEQL